MIKETDDRRAEIEALLDEGQVFLAQDLAQNLAATTGAGTDAGPEVAGLHALALIRSGATEAAAAILDPILREHGLNEGESRRAFAAFHDVIARTAAAPPQTLDADDIRALLADARAAFAPLVAGGDKRLGAGALITFGDCYLELWRRTGDEGACDKAWRLFSSAAALSRRRRPAALAALLGLVTGRREEAAEVARRFDAAPAGAAAPGDAAEPHGVFWRLAGKGAAALIAGDGRGAVSAFEDARAAARATSHRVTLMRALIAALRAPGRTDRADRAVPEALEAAEAVFRPPRIVVFAGIPFDRPGAPPRCPPALEDGLRAAIRARLDALDAQIGYASGSCGADLIFCEAMQERAGEVNVVLPFAAEDFIAERVAYLDPSWPRRFDMAAKLAASVSCATPGPYLGDESLYRFGNQALQGAAVMRARQYGVAPELLTVWDMEPGTGVGDVADFIDRWADMRRLHIIDLDSVAEAAEVDIAAAENGNEADPPAPPPPPPDAPAVAAQTPGRRVIRALMMSDIVGSSRVGEASMPAYAAFMGKIAARLAERAPAPAFANTWGDAIFATAPSALDLAAYALALKDAVLAFGDLDGLAAPPLGMRISLNAGPVLEADDPIAGRMGAFGAEIVRAARIEPVTTPNQIYATDAFVSLLIAEESDARATAEAEGRVWASPYRVDYIGRVKLAKNAGSEGLHHLSAAETAAP